MIVSRQFCGKEWNLDKVMEFFNNELRAQEDCSLSLTNKSEKSRKGDPYTTSGFLSQTGKVSCVYCDEEGHFPSRCSQVSDHQSRKDILRKKRGDVLFV